MSDDNLLLWSKYALNKPSNDLQIREGYRLSLRSSGLPESMLILKSSHIEILMLISLERCFEYRSA